MEEIIIRGAREHNLKNIDLNLPREKFIVITGLSGSGKSSLAFDTIYAEGQRRYLESLSAYARQFVGNMNKPDVDLIEGLSPSISIEQKSTSANPRSTVGTVTEIYDFLRLLFARVGRPYCYNCGKPVKKQSSDQIVENVLSNYRQKKITVLAPVVRGRKGHYKELFEEISRNGFVRVRVDGEIKELEKGLQVERYKIHNIEIIVDKLEPDLKSEKRVRESVEVALSYGEGIVIINDGVSDMVYSRHLACPDCDINYNELAPNSFSFNSPFGACPACDGLGEKKDIDIDLIIPDKNLSIAQGGIAALGKPREMWHFSQLREVCKIFKVSFETPIKKIPKEVLDIILYGSGKERIKFDYKLSSGQSITYYHKYQGVINYIKNYFENTSSPNIKEWAESFMRSARCEKCNGGRLKKEALSVKIGGKNISEITEMSLAECREFMKKIDFTEREKEISRQIVNEITTRIDFLLNVGLDYISLGRGANTLSGGEAQRIRLATQIGTQLTGVLYVLDEPSIGLHQRDNLKLIESLKNLRNLGNTVIVVEHDKETILNSDFIVDLGPGAAKNGGHVVISRETKKLLKQKKTDNTSITVQYLNNQKSILPNLNPRKGNGKNLILTGAKGNNLKDITVKFPLGKFICITGVSGSGKSTLINETLAKILYREIYKSKVFPLEYSAVKGLENLDKIIEIDQSPIGRTPRSNPATYTGLFTLIRDLFTQLPEAQIRGYKAGRFSFNVKGGRCEECEGDGLKKIVMNFLPDVFVQCEVCRGKRYNRETLEVTFKGKSIADVLDMTVEEALVFFEDQPRIRKKIQTLYDVGLTYIHLGQQATTLSGGEAQRVKLATELAKIQTGNTLYILDEPTTGLHFEDVRILLEVLNKLVDSGNTVIVIEHNIDVIKSADYIIDLGPEGGNEGGKIIAEGSVQDVAEIKDSYTGKFLKKELTIK